MANAHQLMHDPSAEAANPENSVICGAVAYRGLESQNATKGYSQCQRGQREKERFCRSW